MSHGGKGDTPRPLSVDQKTFENNWDLIFNKGKQFPLESKKEKQEVDQNSPNDSQQEG